MARIDGSCDHRFEGVRTAFEENFDQGLDVGASVCVTLDGATVVDLWGGTADGTLEQPGQTPWTRNTITNVWSTTKTMTALCALMLADRGELDLHAPVARYWPEFKAGGKEGVTVANLMSHTAGLSGWQERMQPEDLYDWDLACARLAAQEPWWEPGTASGYHAITQGYLVGEVIRRVDGRTVGRFFADEVAGPLGADFHIGLAAEHDARVAKVIPPPPLDAQLAGVDPDSIAMRTMTNPPISAEQSWDEAWRRAEIPAAGGHGNARSVARAQSVLACGGELDGVRLLSAAGSEAVLEEQSNGPDLVLGVPLRFGIGYGLMTPEIPLSPNPRSYFWGGWGGSLVVVDLDARLCVAYVMNRMGEGTLGDTRGINVLFAAYGALEALGA
jgi:CubicO group peptidase (beta-lactamase class C family)